MADDISLVGVVDVTRVPRRFVFFLLLCGAKRFALAPQPILLGDFSLRHQRKDGPGAAEPRLDPSPAAVAGARAPAQSSGRSVVRSDHRGSDNDGAHTPASQGETWLT